MGLFSGKKKTYVGVSVSRLIQDEDIVDAHKAALLDYTLGNNGRVDALATSFTEVYQEKVNNSLGVKALNQIAWARKKYYYGTMEGYTVKEGSLDIPLLVKDYLVKKYNSTQVELEYAKYGPINNHHAVYQKLIDLYKYDLDTNKIQGEYANTYLDSFKIYYCKGTYDNVVNLDYLNPLGIPSMDGATNTRSKGQITTKDTWEVDNEAEHDYVVVTFSYMSEGVEKKYTVRLDFLDYEFSTSEGDNDGFIMPDDAVLDLDYYMVRYKVGDKSYLLTYAPDKGDDVALNGLIPLDIDPGKYMPQMYISLDRKKMNRDSEKGSDAHKTSVTYCRQLGLDYDNLVDSIWDEVVEAENTVRDVILAYRLPASSKDPLIQKYMYHFFYEMYKDVEDVPVRSSFQDIRQEDVSVQARKGISYTLRDRVSSLIVSYTSIGTRLVKGELGDVGTVNFVFTREGNSSAHTYKMQVAENVYREVVVRGLTVTQKVVGAADRLLNNQDEGLLIPIDYGLVRKLFSKERNEIMVKSLYIIVTTKKVVKQKWYETGVFKVVVFIAAVAISVFTGGAGVTLLAVLKAAAVAVAVNVAVSTAVKLLVALGLDVGIAAAIVAVVALVAGGYAYSSNSTIAGMNASDYLAIANHSFQASNQGMQLEMQAKYDAYLEYMDILNDKKDNLMELRKELGLEDGVNIDMYTLLSSSIRKPDVRLGESPLSFLDRTTSVASGRLSVEVVNNYALLATQLPTFESLFMRNTYV